MDYAKEDLTLTNFKRQFEPAAEIAELATDEVFVMPTSVAQQRFWLLDQLEPGNTSLNMPLALKLAGKLDITSLKQALNEVVSRHEMLRTTFVKTNGKPEQVISQRASLPLDIIDLSERSERDEQVNGLMVEEAHLPFDLVNGPLFRVKLIRLTAQEHVLLLTMHHIICDGWSNGVLIREIGEIYNAFSHGCPSPYEELPIQYADFAVWQKDWLGGNTFEEQLAYWKQQLGDELPALELPTDFPRNRNRASFGAIESVLLPHAMTRAVKALGQREEVTPYMIFLTAFSVLLHRYSGQEKIVIGSPTANRTLSETEGLIGPFANTLLLKFDLSGEPSFNELLRRVKDVALGAFSNQGVPFEKLVETIRPSTNGRRGGQLFQVLFIFQTAFMQPMEFEDLAISPIRSVSPGSIFELSLGIVERNEGTRLQLEYNTDLFLTETVKCMLGDLESVIQSALLDGNRKVPDLLPFTTPIKRGSEHQENAIQEVVAVPEVVVPNVHRSHSVEDTLVEIWKNVLHLNAVNIQDDFFEVGGHSLLAAQLFDEITKRLGVNLSLATLFKATTIEKLASIIREEGPKDKWTSMVPITTSGTNPPLFLMHAAGGNVLFYKDLANRLGPDQPCYGMQAVGLDGHQSAYDRIEDMAAHYLEEIVAVQPKGPYFLGGSSLGGLIAYEIGMQLSRRGEEVKLIALIDTHAPGFPKFLSKRSKINIKFFKYVDQAQHHLDTLRILEPGKRWPYFKAKSIKAKNQIRRSFKQTKKKISRGVLKGLGRPLPEALMATQNKIRIAAKAYKPAPYGGDVVLFRASKKIRGVYPDETLGWSKYVRGQLTIHEVNGSHGSIVAEPRVRFVSAIVKELIDGSKPAGSPVN